MARSVNIVELSLWEEPVPAGHIISNTHLWTHTSLPTTNLEQLSCHQVGSANHKTWNNHQANTYQIQSNKQTNMDPPTSYQPITTNWSTISYQMQYKKTMVAKRKESEKLSNYLNWGGRGILIENHSILSLYAP